MYTADELEIRRALAGSPRSEQLIACLEGEIAKRDAELCECTEEVEHALADLNNALAELAAIKAQEPVAYISGCYRDVIGGKSDRTPLGAELAFVNMGWIGQIPLYAAPVSEAKAQGVVMPEPLTAAITRADDVLHAISSWDSSSVKLEQRHGSEWAKEVDAIRRELHTQLARLNAAPAAPAADAGLVDALEMIINPIEAMRRELQGGEQLNGMVAMQLASDPEYLRGVAKAALAAHRAKGVV